MVRGRAATLWGVGLLGAYVTSRTYALLRLPPFLDEALAIVWGRKLWSGGWWNAPSADGKLLSVAIVGVVDALWPTGWPVLLGARLVSVFCGGVALACCFIVGRRLGGDVAGGLGGVVYLVSPYALWHDRLCLADSHLAAATGLVFASTVRLMKSGSLASAVVLGVALVAAVLTKVSGGLLFVVPLAALLMKPSELSWRPLLRRLTMAYGVSAPVSLWVLSMVWWSPRSSQLAKVEPFVAVAQNLEVSADWFRAYWTFPLWVLVATCCVAVVATYQRRSAFLLAGIAAPVAFFAITAGIWWPRYLLMTVVPMAVSVGLVLGHLWDRLGRAARWGLAAAFVLAVVPAIRWDIRAVRTPDATESRTTGRRPVSVHRRVAVGLRVGRAGRRLAVAGDGTQGHRGEIGPNRRPSADAGCEGHDARYRGDRSKARGVAGRRAGSANLRADIRSRQRNGRCRRRTSGEASGSVGTTRWPRVRRALRASSRGVRRTEESEGAGAASGTIASPFAEG